MSSILPVPTTRVADPLVRERMLAQLQGDQIALFRLQSQISTGRRLMAPSDDAPSAQRGISLQSLLERKQQVQVNLTTNLSFLEAADTALAGISAILADTRGAAVGVADVTASIQAKRAVAEQVHRTIQQLLDAGNQRFRGRFLFAGSNTVDQPFVNDDALVRYAGNEGELLSYADIDLLFATNVTGHQVFQTISTQVTGTADLGPQLTSDTLLRDLRGGLGISPGSIEISDGLNFSVIDLSGAETVRDVVELIEAYPPEGTPPTGRTATVTVTATGLNVTLNGSVGAGLTIKEVGGGTLAAQLGLLSISGSGNGPIVGTDLNPQLKLTTRLSDLPSAVDLTSGLKIVNGGDTYDVSFGGAQTVEDLLNALNGSEARVTASINAAGTGIDLRSTLSGTDFSIGENGGTTAADLGVRSFTVAAKLGDLNHGFGVHDQAGDDFAVRRKDGTTFNIDVAGAATIGDVLDLINNHPENVVPFVTVDKVIVASLAVDGNGIQLTTADTSTTTAFQVVKLNGSQAGEDLGLLPVGQAASAPAVAGGGVETIAGRDVNPLEVRGVFTALIRLRDALERDDLLQIQRAIEVLDFSTTELNFSRAELGARQQGLDTLKSRLDDERVNLEATLSKEIDVDFIDVVSQLTARQASFQATLQLAGKALTQTLLDYL